MRNKNSYWKKRVETEMEARLSSGDTVASQMRSLHDYYFSNIQKEIESFYQRYADKSGLSKAVARKLVSDFDVVGFSDKAARYVREKNFSARANSELALYNLKMKVSRLELLQYNLDLELVALADEEKKLTERFLRSGYMEEVSFQAGLLAETVASPRQLKDMAEAIINVPFKGASWSENIWKRQGLLREILQEEIRGAVLKGRNPVELIPQLRKEFDVSYQEARRLAITEYARVQSEVQKASMKANDFVKYVYLAESGACKICASHDDRVYLIDEMTPGENCAPMHPHCRCSAAPVFEEFDKKTVDGDGVWTTDDENSKIKTPKNSESTGHNFVNFKDAESYAISNGVQYADFSKMRPEWFNAILNQLDNTPMEARPVVITDTKTFQQLSGVKISRRVNSYYGVAQHFSGIFTKVNGEYTTLRDGTWVGYNTTSYKTFDSIAKARSKTEKAYFERTGKKWSLLKTAEETVAHELGHVLDNYKNASDNFEWKQISKRWHEESDYDHLKSPSEAWADAIGLDWNGKKLPEYVKDYLVKYFNNF